MIIVMKNKISEEEISRFIKELTASYPIQIQQNTGSECTVLGVLGDASAIEMDDIQRDARVEKVMRVKEPLEGKQSLPSR